MFDPVMYRASAEQTLHDVTSATVLTARSPLPLFSQVEQGVVRLLDGDERGTFKK
jgi:hypothetical protein